MVQSTENKTERALNDLKFVDGKLMQLWEVKSYTSHGTEWREVPGQK